MQYMKSTEKLETNEFISGMESYLYFSITATAPNPGNSRVECSAQTAKKHESLSLPNATCRMYCSV